MSEDQLEVEGVVKDSLPNTLFKVDINGNIILSHLSGKMRLNKIRISIGDKVLVSMSYYDMTKGRIIRRL